MSDLKTDNTVLSYGWIKDDVFYPKKNLPSGTLRIVLTTECNFRCKYCFAEGEANKEIRVLPLENIKKVLDRAPSFGITKIKLTGGEPLLYPHLEELLAYIREIDIPYVDLTTNISCLTPKVIQMLNRYQVNALTLSLNTLEKDKFEYLSDFHHFDILQDNLFHTLKLFQGSIRINCIIFDELYRKEDYDSILTFCMENHLGLRFVEPSIVENLPITYTKKRFSEYISQLREKADKVIRSDCSSVEYLFFHQWYVTVMHSLCDNKLCESCAKYMYMRVNSELKLKPCLSRSDTEVPISFESQSSIENAFIEAIGYMGKGVLDQNKEIINE